MRKTLYAAAGFIIVGSAFIGGAYAASIKTATERALEECAAKYYVHQCTMVAIPTKGYEVRKVLPELLPIPLEGNEAGF